MGAALPAGSAATPRRGDSMRGLSLDLFLTGFTWPDLSRVFWVFFLVGGGVWVARRDVSNSVSAVQRSAVLLVWVLVSVAERLSGW